MHRRHFLKSVSALGALALLGAPGGVSYAASCVGWRQRMRPMMGSFVGLAIYSNDYAWSDQVIDECFTYIESLAQKLSDYDCESDLSRLRRAGSLKLSEVSTDFLRVSELAFKVKELTGGLYEPLCYSLSKLWRAARDAQSLPHRIEVVQAIDQVQRTRFLRGKSELRLDGDSGFDFGGIGQGYIADQAALFLESRGVRIARVDCSGDIKFVGDLSWQVEIENPRQSGRILRRLLVSGGQAVSTSGDYRNCWFVNGKRFHHLIDPRSGMPQTRTQQVTLVHRSAAIADALDTALAFSTPQESRVFMEKFSPCQALIVDHLGRQHWLEV